MVVAIVSIGYIGVRYGVVSRFFLPFILTLFKSFTWIIPFFCCRVVFICLCCSIFLAYVCIYYCIVCTTYYIALDSVCVCLCARLFVCCILCTCVCMCAFLAIWIEFLSAKLLSISMYPLNLVFFFTFGFFILVLLLLLFFFLLLFRSVYKRCAQSLQLCRKLAVKII